MIWMLECPSGIDFAISGKIHLVEFLNDPNNYESQVHCLHPKGYVPLHRRFTGERSWIVWVKGSTHAFQIVNVWISKKFGIQIGRKVSPKILCNCEIHRGVKRTPRW